MSELESATIESRVDQTRTTEPMYDQSRTTEPMYDQSRTTEPMYDQTRTTEFMYDQSRARQQAVQLFNLSLLRQLCRFGLVGITAASINFFIVVFLVQTFSCEPLVANIFAFIVSFQASYYGHRRFTFNGTTALHTVAFPKLLMLQVINLTVNESLFYFFLSLHLPYQLALLIVLSILPFFTFIVSKFWVFK